MNEFSMPPVDLEVLVNECRDDEWIPAPCQRACPVGTDVASYVTLVWEEKIMEAAEAIAAANPFASVCGHACAMPCEGKCRRAEIGDKAVTIRALKRFVMDQVGEQYRPPVSAATRSQTIGVVGAGPAGLTAANDLARMGYEVHVYEKSDRPGGMMRAIPEWRLPRKAIENDILRLLESKPGIKLHLNCSLGDGIGMEELKKRHDAVIITVGLWKDRKLNVPGESEVSKGLYGLNLMTDLADGKPAVLGGRAVIVGGGNVAMDVARTALRLGAEKADLYCLEARSEMPAADHEIEQAIKEGVVVHNGYGPKRIVHADGRVAGVEMMRCLSVFDEAGRFAPSYDPEEVVSVEADNVLVCIGLAGESEELEKAGLTNRGLVVCDPGTAGTSDPKVFAAGDCVRGPSSVVEAMAQGHKAAYFVHAYVQGVADPKPYRVAYSTRRLPVPQDPRWEKLPREDQDFRGIDNTCSFPRLSPCESAFDLETAKRQAARCFRCDAETGTAGYQRRDREHMRAMSQTEPGDAETYRAILLERLRPRDNPFPEHRPAQLDDVHFLPAGLTRLVIDPYREACATETPIAGDVSLKLPYLFTGFDRVAGEVREALAQALAASGCGYVGFDPLPPVDSSNGASAAPWFQLLLPDKSEPSEKADGLLYVLGKRFKPVRPERKREKQLLGLTVAAEALAEAIPYALKEGFDLLLLDGTGGIEQPWPELDGFPDLTCLPEAIDILRSLNSEERIALFYFGGLRTGTDVAKILAINCNAGVFSVAAAIAMGGALDVSHIDFNGDMKPEDRREALERWIKATAQESTIIARSTGKTNVHNIEPEDLRAVTLATSRALRIPLAAGMEIRTDY